MAATLVTVQLNTLSEIKEKTSEELASMSFKELLDELCLNEFLIQLDSVFNFQHISIPNVKKYIKTIVEFLDLKIISDTSMMLDKFEKTVALKRMLLQNLAAFESKIIKEKNCITVESYYVNIKKCIDEIITYRKRDGPMFYVFVKLFLHIKVLETIETNPTSLNMIFNMKKTCLEYFKSIINPVFIISDWELIGTQFDNNREFMIASFEDRQFIKDCCLDVEKVRPIAHEYTKLKLIEKLFDSQMPEDIKNKMIRCIKRMIYDFDSILDSGSFASCNCSCMALKADEQDNPGFAQTARQLRDQINATLELVKSLNIYSK
jgi:hypothetical protein